MGLWINRDYGNSIRPMNGLRGFFSCNKLSRTTYYRASYMDGVHSGYPCLTALINGKRQQFVATWHKYCTAFKKVFVELFFFLVLKKSTLRE